MSAPTASSTTAPGDWMKSLAFVTVTAHIGWGALVMFTACVLAHVGAHPWRVASYVQTVLALTIGFKEAWIDPRYETGENLVTGFWDWMEWMAGCVIAWGVCLLAAHLGAW